MGPLFIHMTEQGSPVVRVLNRYFHRRALAAFAIAGLGAMAASALALPLPWLVGPVLAVGLACIAGMPLRVVPGSRQVGQGVVGAALGLGFSPMVMAYVAGHLEIVLATAAGSVLIGMAYAFLLRRLGALDPTTAFLAAMPGSAAEMSNLAERWGARLDYVAAAQILRLVMVVLTVPAAMLAWGAAGTESIWAVQRSVTPDSLSLLLGAVFLGGVGLRLIRFPNAWMLGPLLAVASLSALSLHLAPVPAWLVNAGQMLIGIGLGVYFGAGFWREATRFLLLVGSLTGMTILLSAALAFALAYGGVFSSSTLVLATAPGGIAEMSLVAAGLHLAVPVVVVCHVSRLVALLVLAQPLYWVFERCCGNG